MAELQRDIVQNKVLTTLGSDREIKLVETRLKFEKATAEQRFGGPGEGQSELQISQEATRLTKDAVKFGR